MLFLVESLNKLHHKQLRDTRLDNLDKEILDLRVRSVAAFNSDAAGIVASESMNERIEQLIRQRNEIASRSTRRRRAKPRSGSWR